MSVYALVSAIQWVHAHLSFSDIALALLGLFAFSCLREKLTNNGPMSWPVLGITPAIFIHMDHLFDWATEALTKAGGTFSYRGVWLGGSYGVMTAHPYNIQYMLKTNFKNFPKGRSYKERFQDLLEDGIFNADDELWKEQRVVAKTEMHSSRFLERSFRTMSDLVQEKLLKLMAKLARSRECFDLQDVLLRFTFDNICMAAFGVDPGSLAIDLPKIPFAKAFEEATEYSLFRFVLPPFVWKPMKFLGIGSERKLKNAIEIVHNFANETVRARRNELEKLGNLNHKSDLLSRLLQKEKNQKEGGMDDKNLNFFSDKFFRGFCTSFIIAGRDTTSVALAWFFWLINNNPEVETKILNEIKQILRGREKLEAQATKIFFAPEELRDMIYLQAAITESLRLYPSVPMEVKQAVKDDIFPDGTFVREGARVYFSVFSMGRMESIWGKDCLEFRPERWIRDGKLAHEDQFKYTVFNAGPRLCVGKRFAFMQMKMVAASILLRYSVEVAEGQSVVPKVTTTLYMKNGLLVNLKSRDAACG